MQGRISQPHTFSTAATFMMWEVLATLTDLACLATVLQLAAGALAVNAIAIGVQSLQVCGGLKGLAVGTAAGDEGTALGVGNTLALRKCECSAGCRTRKQAADGTATTVQNKYSPKCYGHNHDTAAHDT